MPRSSSVIIPIYSLCQNASSYTRPGFPGYERTSGKGKLHWRTGALWRPEAGSIFLRPLRLFFGFLTLFFFFCAMVGRQSGCGRDGGLTRTRCPGVPVFIIPQVLSPHLHMMDGGLRETNQVIESGRGIISQHAHTRRICAARRWASPSAPCGEGKGVEAKGEEGHHDGHVVWPEPCHDV